MQYVAELENVSAIGEAETARWRIELEQAPANERRRGRRISYVSPDLERFMPMAGS